MGIYDVLSQHAAWLAFFLIFLGSFVQTAVGFGLAVVASPLLFIISPDYIPASVTLMAFLISSLSAMKYRTSISVGGLKNALIWRIPGSIIGGLLLLWVSKNILSLWLGLLVLFSVAVSLLPFRLEPTPKRMGIAGFFSGFFGTSSGIGGPPMALLLQHQEATQLKGNLSAFFLFSSLISLVVQFAVGYFRWHHLMLALPLIPAAILGYVLGMRLGGALNKEKLRLFMLILCFVSGVTSITQSIW